jgi:iron complex transport system substrate-binding protein
MRMHLSATSAKLVTALVVLVGVACGTTSTPDASASAGASHYPLTITEAGGGTVTIAKQPRRIVSLSPTATEMLFAINAGPQVVAVDDQSNYPASAPMTKLSAFQPNVEAIVAYTPDLVVAADDTGGIVHALGELSIPVLIEPAAHNLDDSYAQITQLGVVTSHVSEAQDLVKKMRSEIATATARVDKLSRPLKVYHELDDTYYSATSKTFIGQVYQLLGLQNIADGATGAASDYPQLSSEYIVSSDPDLIVLADTKCCHQDASTVGARPGWSAIAAVKKGQVIGVDDDIASRWGPRVVDFLNVISEHVAQLEQAA